MKVVVAPDKFAGTLTASEAAVSIADGWQQRRPTDRLVRLPMSDGGPGFVEAVHAALGGEISVVTATGPHGDPVVARLLYVGQRIPTAYIEAADCCGLHLAANPRRPVEATTEGLAVLLRAAITLPVGRVVVGVGGTASTDGGIGLVSALGAWPPSIDLVVATDVEHPLLGESGAARSFAPQKGASAAEVDELERRLTAWARVVEIESGQPGAGAGGGLGYGLMALGARRVGGASLVAQACGLGIELQAADLVITGEGSLDYSSLNGKVVSVVGGLAAQAGRPCIALAGRVDLGPGAAASIGLTELHSLTDRVGEQAAMDQSVDELAALASEVAGLWEVS